MMVLVSEQSVCVYAPTSQVRVGDTFLRGR